MAGPGEEDTRALEGQGYATTTTQLAPDTKPNAKVQEHPKEARAYHARYDYVGQGYDEGRYDECRVGSLYLLLEPRLPFWTRIKTLQMVSTLLEPAGAEGCLQQAEAVIKLCDPDDFRTALFRDDNAEMVDDVVQWRIERGLVGESIDGEDDAEDGELVEEDKEIDDQLEEKLKEETETETKAIGRLQTLPVRAKPAELAQKPDTPAAEGLPLPQESDTQ